MYRPPRPRYPRMMNNFNNRGPRPYNHQWTPNYGPPALFTQSNPHFRANHLKSENLEEHWCDTCDRGFPTEELLHKHKQQHQKCNIDGCQFIAHPKVITKHIQMQHSQGLFKKIAKLNSPEEIQKWREERKNKYPTKSNIERKMAECKEKTERGEKMALKPSNWKDKQKISSQGSGMKRNNSLDKRNPNQRMKRHKSANISSVLTNYNDQPAKKVPKIIPSAPTMVQKNKLKPFTGILNIEISDKVDDTPEVLESNNILFDDDYEEILENPQKSTNSQESVVCGALTSLMCDYGTSDEESGEKENDSHNGSSNLSGIKLAELPKTDNRKIEIPVEVKPKLMEKNESDDDGPEEVKIVKTNVQNETDQELIKTPKQKAIKKISPPRQIEKQNYKLKHKIPSTLLQKLLHKEIRKERNIVLQCIRYIKKNNYFDNSDN